VFQVHSADAAGRVDHPPSLEAAPLVSEDFSGQFGAVHTWPLEVDQLLQNDILPAESGHEADIAKSTLMTQSRHLIA
jgi:hypothetical protein